MTPPGIEFYGIRVEASRSSTLDEFLRERLRESLEVGRSVTVGAITVTAREIVDGRGDRGIEHCH
jgi:hypothetical protein